MHVLRSSRACGSILVALLVTWVVGDVALSADRARYGVGAGLAAGRYSPERGTIEDSTGAYLVMLFQSRRGFLARTAISFGDFHGTGSEGTIDIGTLRMDLSVGRVFRNDEVLQPFVHGGVALLSLSVPSTGGGALVEDDTAGLTAGAGLLAVRGRQGLLRPLVRSRSRGVHRLGGRLRLRPRRTARRVRLDERCAGARRTASSSGPMNRPARGYVR
jgi:hypothetical protein